MGWLLYQPYVLGDSQAVRSVPSGSIDEHDDEVFFEITGDFLQEQVHHGRVRVGQDQGSYLTEGHAHCRIHVDEGPDHLPGDFWPDPFGRPARSNIRDASETSFVLSHDDHRPIICRISVSHNLGYEFREVFLKASCVSSLASG